MHKAFINPEKCLRCSDCKAAKACSIRAIFQIDKTDPAIVNPKFCRGCGDCMSSCLGKAIELKAST